MISVVCGLTYGDEGKGTITDYLVRETGARMVARYNGGPQAGHNVVTDDGRWHCFAQLGAGSFVGGVMTLHGPKMLVELENLEVEAAVLEKKGVEHPLWTVRMDPKCVVVTPMHKMLCQMKEVAAGKNRKGSCGLGVGEAARNPLITVSNFDRLEQLASESFEHAKELRGRHPSAEMDELFAYFEERCRPGVLRERYERILKQVTLAPTLLVGGPGSPVIFEGAQGALLDRDHGVAPYVTQSKTTYHNVREMVHGPIRKIGVLRAYAHRHGPGPFATEDKSYAQRFADPYNRENRWQGAFRVGPLDLADVRRGVQLNEGIDELAITGLDRLTGLDPIRVCVAHDPLRWIEVPGWSAELRGPKLPREARRFLEVVEEQVGVTIGIVSVGPDAKSKFRLRSSV